MSALASLSTLCFEDACLRLDAESRALADALARSIPDLAGASWHHEKLRVHVEPAQDDGRRARSAIGPRHKADARLCPKDAESAWTLFQTFAAAHGLRAVRHHEAEDSRRTYYFQGIGIDTGDEVRCLIYLPGSPESPHLSIGVFVGPRFRREALAEDESPLAPRTVGKLIGVG
ncbi:MAG: hypothetical protein FWC46_08630 [Actinomycetia bacterium]|nr:hypothetical protein [Actinomycetes bacterium]